jgi:hypothetical protein
VPTAGNLVAGELAINTADGRLYYKDSSGVVQTIASKAGALGDVVGPSSATDNAIVRFDATTGKLIQNSLVTVSDAGAISAPVDASISGITVGKGGGSNSGSNSVFGLGAGAAATTADGVVAIGQYALNANTTGANTAVGYRAMAFSNTTGSLNTAIGGFALFSNTTASNNTAVGYQAGYSGTTALGNTYVGYQAGYSVATGSTYNTMLGFQAGQNTTGTYNTFVGTQAGQLVTSGGKNTILGLYNGNQGGLDIRTASNYIVLSDGDGNPRQVIDSSGNVGIGTGSPATRLVVGGSTGNYGLQIAARTDFGTLSGQLLITDSTGSACLYTNSGSLTFNTGATVGTNGGTERMRISSGGKVLINTNDTGFPGVLLARSSVIADEAISVWNNTTTGDGLFVKFYTDAGSGRGQISYNRVGGLTVYGTTSDYRAKDIISPVLNSGEIIDSVPVYMGKMKDATQARPMFIAHETPDYAHIGEKDAIDKDGKPIYQQMDASSLVPVLWAEIQSLRKRVAQLESK